MNILLTNLYLDRYAGTEMYVRDLTLALRERGHNVEIFSPEPGKVARELERVGISVASSCADLVTIPDIIHAHHFVPAVEAILRFPETPVVYFVHDRLFEGDAPPKHSQVLKFVAVDHNCLEKLTIDNQIRVQDTDVIYNWVDTGRFRLRDGRPAKPSRALVFSNYARRDNYFKTIREACEETGLEIDGLGDALNKMAEPETIIGEYDIVFAKAKAAIEAMATGAAVIVCDEKGLGEMVTTANFDHYRRFNFGMRVMTSPVARDGILGEIAKYDASECARVTRAIREQASFDRAMERILSLYRETIEAYAAKGARPDSEDAATVTRYQEQKKIYLAERHQRNSPQTRIKAGVRRIDEHFFNGAFIDKLRPKT